MRYGCIHGIIEYLFVDIITVNSIYTLEILQYYQLKDQNDDYYSQKKGL